MIKIRYILIALNLLLLIGYFNWSVYAKEKIIHEGRLVLLELAPVDPRSLMQGDYMSLNYSANTFSKQINIPKRGFCILKLDANHVGHRVALTKNLKSVSANQIAIKYFFSGNEFWPAIHIGSESYFFEEGQGKKYEAAKYGGLKVDQDGNSLLIGLYDKNLKMIQ